MLGTETMIIKIYIYSSFFIASTLMCLIVFGEDRQITGQWYHSVISSLTAYVDFYERKPEEVTKLVLNELSLGENLPEFLTSMLKCEELGKIKIGHSKWWEQYTDSDMIRCIFSKYHSLFHSVLK